MIDALAILNALLSAGVLIYAIRIEHRFTKLETRMEVVMHKLRLMDEPG